MKIFTILIYSILFSSHCFADKKNESPGRVLESTLSSKATYLGNEAIMVEAAGKKILFDPFFHNVFGTYQLVPEKLVDALMNGIAPYDNIDAIFISHAHGDHFFAPDLVSFLSRHPGTHLIAPQQAVDQLVDHSDFHRFEDQIISIGLKYQEPPLYRSVGGIDFNVVRIPHAGWPQRADVSNLVYRVHLAEKITVIHMGDADPTDSHFKPLQEYWANSKTNTAFPPYWFLTSQSGQMILSERIRADKNIGLHVPVDVPKGLQQSGEKYFSFPGEVFHFLNNRLGD